MRRRTLLGALGTGAAAAGVGCLGTLGTAGARCDDDCDVGMSTAAFRPRELTVAVGETVRWVNTSSRAHTVTAYGDGVPDAADYFASGGFDTERAAREAWNARFGGRIDTGEAYEHAFEVPGTYAYFCIPHEAENMVGSVTVTEG